MAQPIEGQIKCTKCHTSKDKRYFSFRSDRGYYHSICRVCLGDCAFSLFDKQNKIEELFKQGLKECNKCKEVLSIESFSMDNVNKHNLKSICKSCAAKKNNPVAKWAALKTKYNITKEEYDSLFLSQNKKCSICTTDLSVLDLRHIHLDHCHKTGNIRNILCRYCNLGLGKFKDNQELIFNSMLYLQKHQQHLEPEYHI